MKNTDKISTKVNKTLVWGVVMMLSISTLSAQTDLPDAPEDTTPVPIDDYVLVLALIGLLYVFLRIQAFVKQGNIESK